MKKLSAFYYRKTSFGVLILVTIIFTFFTIIVLPWEAQRSQERGLAKTPDTSFIYSANDLYKMANSYGADGRQYYVKSRFSFDIIWPLVYYAFLTVALSFVWRKQQFLINLLPLGGVIFDFLENSGAAIIMTRYPNQTPFIDSITPFFTLFKWLLIAGSFLFLIVGIFFNVGKKTSFFYQRSNH